MAVIFRFKFWTLPTLLYFLLSLQACSGQLDSNEAKASLDRNILLIVFYKLNLKPQGLRRGE